ncbi:LysR family transcriptional regulator [Lutimaribacter marinistellae]|uniref:LysR family transcriptional regulator n=1 Tax=Lutimaribacter marinistellae TaxID=1820329 RepID=A0ABV7THX4_9RHOB
MPPITLKQLEALVAVADLGSFRRAAERLNTTQPNISNRIAQLESQLRVVLMERDAGSVRLTARGREILAHARTVLSSMDALVAAAGDATLFEGVLRLGVSELVAHTWLMPFLKEMRTAYPSVDVELTVDLSANLSDALFARDLDLTFQSGPFDRRTEGTVPLDASPYSWVAAPSLGIASPLSEADLTANPVLTHARGTHPFQQLEAHFRATRIAARLVPSSNIAACLRMSVDGLGIACLPDRMLTPYLEDGRLRRLDYPWVPDDLRFAARYLSDPAPAYLSGAIKIARCLSQDQKS